MFEVSFGIVSGSEPPVVTTLKNRCTVALDTLVDGLRPILNEMHIHPASPNSASSHSSEEDAATKIQAGFRGYRVRKAIRNQKPTTSGGASSGTGSSQAGVGAGPQTRGKKLAASLEDKSATKIQAGVRGFLVRKRQKVATEAATKIQASFRGFKTRKDLTKKEK